MAWFQTVSDAVAKMLCACFGLDPTSDEAAYRFIPAYTEEATTPQAPRNKDVVYYTLSESQGIGFDYIQFKNIIKDSKPKTLITKTVPVNVLLTFYGSNADDDAEHFWSALMVDTGHGSPREILRRANIVPVGCPDRPIAVFEVEGTYHRRRCDVRLNLAYLEMPERETSFVEHAPEIEYVQNL